MAFSDASTRHCGGAMFDKRFWTLGPRVWFVMQNIIFLLTLAVFSLSFVHPVSSRRIFEFFFFVLFIGDQRVKFMPVILGRRLLSLISSFLLFYTWHPLIVRLFINNLVFNEKVSLLSTTTRRRPFTECLINRTIYGIYVNCFRGFFFAPTQFGRGTSTGFAKKNYIRRTRLLQAPGGVFVRSDPLMIFRPTMCFRRVRLG